MILHANEGSSEDLADFEIQTLWVGWEPSLRDLYTEGKKAMKIKSYLMDKGRRLCSLSLSSCQQ